MVKDTVRDYKGETRSRKGKEEARREESKTGRKGGRERQPERLEDMVRDGMSETGRRNRS